MPDPDGRPDAPPPDHDDRVAPGVFGPEKVFLVLAVVAAGVYAAVFVAFSLTIMPFGLIGLAALGLLGWVGYRIVHDHYGSRADRYYEENFDQ